MNGALPVIGLLTSLFLPWFLGGVWVHCILRKSRRWNSFVVAGHGYLLGVLLTTVLIRLWHFTGLPLHYWSIAAAILALTLVGLAVIRLQAIPARVVQVSPQLEKWELAVVALLLGLILLRYGTILQELVLRPLFPWDAWMNWAPKAVVWHYYQDLVPWVSPTDWLTSPDHALAYTEGASNAWRYPVTIPLLQLWGMMALGTSDHTLIYLPWLLVAIALGLALYGHLRLAGASVVMSTLGCYLLLNLPFINAHVALAGYADIWLAATFGCAVFALHEWEQHRQWHYALLSLLLALMCTQLKIPGLILGGIICLTLLSSVISLRRRTSIGLALIASACILYVLCIGLDLRISGVGRIAITTDGIVLPYIGRYDIAYHPVHQAMIETTLSMVNWNILWYLFIFFGLTMVITRRSFTAPSLVLRSILLTLFFILFVYYFTNRYIFALDHTQVNRALIYTIPPVVFYLIYVCCLQPGPRKTARRL
jgi:hypothetical protein